MGKINAALSQVSTEFTPIDAGTYTWELEKVEDIKEGEKVVGHAFFNKVTDPGEMNGRVFKDRVYLNKNDGTPNEISLANIKRYFEAIKGKDVVAGYTDDDFDTDDLHGGMFAGQVKIETYQPKNKQTGEPEGEPRKSNRWVFIDSL